MELPEEKKLRDSTKILGKEIVEIADRRIEVRVLSCNMNQFNAGQRVYAKFVDGKKVVKMKEHKELIIEHGKKTLLPEVLKRLKESIDKMPDEAIY